METICTFENGDRAQLCERAILLRFAGPRRVLSTSPWNGGVQEALHCVFNRDCKAEAAAQDGQTASYAALAVQAAETLGLDPAHCAGLLTAAQMEHAVLRTERSGPLSVTAIVTGGVDKNANRAGDPASWEEGSDGFHPVLGTINILLHFNAALTPGALTQALITCTEAKTVAVQELVTPSCYSSGLATGSGTDGAILVCDTAAALHLTDAGKHGRLGELIARCVIPAVKEALFRQTGQCAATQHSAASRLARFGLHPTADDVTAAALLARLLDEVHWGMLTREDCHAQMRKLAERLGIGAAALSSAVMHR